MKIKRNSFADRLICAFFPRRCKYCGKLILPEEELCESCKAYLPRIAQPVCFYCGQSEKDCKCKKHKHFFSAVAAPFYYEGAIVRSVHRMKFDQRPFLCREYAEDMADTVEKLYSDIKFDSVCFVPFSKRDYRRRDFNQSELLARNLSEIIGVELTDVFSKQFETSTQHFQTVSTRRGNVFSAFDIKNPEKIKDKTILLVDDVKTTGATLEECSKLLKIYGAAKVYCICFAVSNKKQIVDTND